MLTVGVKPLRSKCKFRPPRFSLRRLAKKLFLDIEICILSARNGGADEVRFGGAFSPARRVGFRKSGNLQNVRVLSNAQNRRKGCCFLEVVKNVHFSWQAQYLVLLNSVLICSKRSFHETVVEFDSAMLTSFRVAVTGLRMPRIHFFRGRRNTCVTKHRKIVFRIGRLTSRCGWNSDFLSPAVARCRFHVWKRSPLQSLCVSDRSRCGALLTLMQECGWPSVWGISIFGARNPLQFARVGSLSLYSAVPILISSVQPAQYVLRVGSVLAQPSAEFVRVESLSL